jgi:hypothetical protein
MNANEREFQVQPEISALVQPFWGTQMDADARRWRAYRRASRSDPFVSHQRIGSHRAKMSDRVEANGAKRLYGV